MVAQMDLVGLLVDQVEVLRLEADQLDQVILDHILQ